MKERIGVFLCECGPNIKNALDLKKLNKYVSEQENVVFSGICGILCSDAGKAFIGENIKKHNISHVVTGACSPKEHQDTFRNFIGEAGLNPFCIQMANIREQCVWVVKDREKALEKAKILIRAAIKRVIHNNPIELEKTDVCPDVLVIGAGISGISAALTLSGTERKIFVIEKSPCIGGKASLFEKLYQDMSCSSCILVPEFDYVLHSENIEILTLARLEDVKGSYGNFIVTIKTYPRYVDIGSCIGCDLCVNECPVEVDNKWNFGINKRKAIYIPYPGAMPNAAVLDSSACLRFQDKDCNKCEKICPFGSINFDDGEKKRQIKVGAIIVATGYELFDLKNAPEYGYGKIKNIFTSLEFERILNTDGPSLGEIPPDDGKLPEKIVFIHCAGSRSSRYIGYCSEICCRYMIKLALMVKEKYPDISVANLYYDLRLYEKSWGNLYDKALEREIKFIRMVNPDSVYISKGNNEIIINYKDFTNKDKMIAADMVILAPPVIPCKDSGGLSEILAVARDEYGFFIPDDPLLEPVSTVRRGIILAGSSKGPMDIPLCVAHGQAAAAKVLSSLIPGGELKAEPFYAVLNEKLCSGCKICLSLCLYGAITYDAEKRSVKIKKLLCRGCGVCQVACPSSAIECMQFTKRAVETETKALVS